MGVRDMMHRRVSRLDAATAVIAVVALLLLVPSGPNRWFSVVLLALVAVRIALSGRITRRSAARTATIQEAAVLPWSCEIVWDLIKPAERAPLLDPTIRHGSHVAGTPLGLGEQQAFEHHDGSVSIIEVLAYVDNRCAVVSQVSPTPEHPMRMYQSVEPTDGGCVYRYAVHVDIAGECLNPEYEAWWRNDARQHIARIRQVLSDAGPPATTPSPPDP